MLETKTSDLEVVAQFSFLNNVVFSAFFAPIFAIFAVKIFGRKSRKGNTGAPSTSLRTGPRRTTS
jgi:hypothetical protein